MVESWEWESYIYSVSVITFILYSLEFSLKFNILLPNKQVQANIPRPAVSLITMTHLAHFHFRMISEFRRVLIFVAW